MESVDLRVTGSLLERFAVPDLPQIGLPLVPMAVYKAYIVSILEKQSVAEWQAAWASHTVPLVYNNIHAACPLKSKDVLLGVGGSWTTLKGHHSLCRLWAARLDLAHRGGVRAVAEIHECIRCGRKTRAAYLHCLGRDCEAYRVASLDAAWAHLGWWERAMQLVMPAGMQSVP